MNSVDAFSKHIGLKERIKKLIPDSLNSMMQFECAYDEVDSGNFHDYFEGCVMDGIAHGYYNRYLFRKFGGITYSKDMDVVHLHSTVLKKLDNVREELVLEKDLLE